MPSLLVHYPNRAARRVELGPHPLSFGRADHCDVNLPSDEVSREHAQVWLDEAGQVLVADRRSKNGTRVDGGEPFRNEVRVATESIRIGEFEIEVVGASRTLERDAGVRFRPDLPTQVGQRSFYPSSRQIDLNSQRLGLLISLTERIGGAFERKQLLEQALDACCETLGFERGLIALKTQRGDTELPVTRNVQRDATGAYTVSRTLINRALVDGDCAVVNDPAVDLVGQMTESLVRFPICSALCVPIPYRDEILGVIYGDRVTQGLAYTTEDKDFLVAIACQVGVGLSNLRLFERHLDMQRMLAELRQARTIQQRLLPAEPLTAGRVIVAGYNEPSSAVGGDYFDYLPLPDGRIGLVIADVTGHGLPAALMMANFQAAVHVALTDDSPLPAVAARLNRLICRNTATSVFITTIFGRLDPRTGAVEYVNAGHPAPLLLRRGEVVELPDGQSLPLGIEPGEQYAVQQIEPTADLEAALWYTDGLIEAPRADGALLSLPPLIAALERTHPRTVDTLLQAALTVVNDHLGDSKNPDDLTILALQYQPPL